jgi:hypothetical protein
MAGLFTRYRIDIEFRNKIMGGIPKRADVIEGWLRARAGVTQQEELLAATRRTLLDLGLELPETATLDEMIEASKVMAAEKSTNGFKVDPGAGLYVETRQIKAAFKESCNVLFAGERWGVTKKGPRAFLAERVFVEGDIVPLGRTEPDGVDMVIGHVVGPQGPRSTLTYHEYVQQARCSFVVMSANDCISADQWGLLLQHSAENGIGALRSQGHGRYDVLDVTRLKARNAVGFAIRDE